MSYTAAITELRQILADTSVNKVATKKKLIGDIDGVNTTFVTYDKRFIASTLKIFVAGVLLTSTEFTVVDAISGEIELITAPQINDKVVATYYWQFWIDDEIKNFLNKGAETISEVDITDPDQAYLLIPAGLKKAALYFAAETAIATTINYLMNRRHSEEFTIQQDGNNEDAFSQTISAMRKQADGYWDKAVFLRDDFYKRQGKRNLPAFGVKSGHRRTYGPTR